ncbi:MAG TPA: NUDIX domain-containing protein [Bacillota bacterium]|nr:NUDIX domain-containing protein [Bacillota bacterium]
MKYGTMAHLEFRKKVLMIQKTKRDNDPNSGCFTLPGGKLKDLEKIHKKGRLESVIRETQEETGLILIKPRLQGVILFDNSERIFDDWENPENFQVYLFVAENYGGQLIGNSNEGFPQWVNKESILDLPKNEGDKKIYEWLKKGLYFAGVIKHKGKKLDEEGTFVDYFMSFSNYCKDFSEA